MNQTGESFTKTITSNRQARHDYHIYDTIEAGLVLVGTEVKALREGKANLRDAHAQLEDGEMVLYDLDISPYSHGNRTNHEPRRPRKLLLHRREITRLGRRVEEKGFTLIPLKLYFKKGKVKVELALAKGKKHYDKRETIKKRDRERDLAQSI